MELDLKRLISNIDEFVDVDEKVTFTKEQLDQNGLLDLKDVCIKGTISKDSIEDFYMDAKLSGTMVLPCSLTLKPVDYPFSVTISGNLQEMLDEIDENAKKIVNTIDIFPIIWENILMEIPSKVVSLDAQNMQKQGEGWKIITGEEKKVNPELAKLKDLL